MHLVSYLVEVLERDQIAAISPPMLEWLAENLNTMPRDLIQAFYSEKIRTDCGISWLAKFCANEVWFAEFAFWSSSGGRRNIHIPIGENKQGWHSFLSMLKQTQILNIVNSRDNKEGLVGPTRNRASPRSYADAVPSEFGRISQDKPENLKENKVQSMSSSIWVKKEKDMLNINFKSLLVVTKLMEFYSWKEVKSTIEDFFQVSISINPYLADKALIKLNKEIEAEFTN